jgi:hypothetical protein
MARKGQDGWTEEQLEAERDFRNAESVITCLALTQKTEE